MAQLTPEGYKTRTLNEIIEEISGNLKATFGSNFDTSPESPDGQLIGIFAEQIHNSEQAAQAVYQSSDPDVAMDTQLEYVCDYNGVYRREATYTTVSLLFNGVVGSSIPKGATVATQDGLNFTTDVDGVVGTEVSATCTKSGSFEILIDTVTELKTSLAGITKVSNPAKGVAGTLRESNSQLRNRRAWSTVTQGNNTVEAIYSELQRRGAAFVSIKPNDTNVTVEGIPPQSFQTLVVGLTDSDIAEAIFSKKPAGIRAFGNINQEVKDSKGYPHQIGFSRPVTVTIDASMDVKMILGTFKDTKAIIQKTLKEYIEGQLDIGEDIIWSDAFGAAVIGATANGTQVSIRNFKIGRQGSTLSNTDIVLGQIEKSYVGDINVTEVS